MNNTRKFGIEIEFTTRLSGSMIAERLTQAGVSTNYMGYTHRVMESWKIVTDVSVNGGLELVSPPMIGQEGLSQLKTALGVLEQLGCNVDSSCGVHVHLDANNLEVQQIGKFCAMYMKFEQSIDEVMPRSRRASNSRWCASNASRFATVEAGIKAAQKCTSVSQLFNTVCGGTRYNNLNLKSYFSYGTVEIRQHAGSLDFEKLSNWIALLQNMMDKACTTKKVLATGKADITKYAEGKKGKAFFRARRDHFGVAAAREASQAVAA